MHGYSFSGWLNIPDTMPAENLVITGEFILISLTAREGSTTIIDNEDKFIYGLEPGLDIATFESVYVQANGNAHLRYQTYSMNLGTGTKVELVDNRTDEVLDTYYIVIFGDLDGNGMINSLDASILLNATTSNPALED